MDIINLLPSPPHFFSLFLKLTLSLLYSVLNAYRRRTTTEYRPPADFDIDHKTGFFPPEPLSKLPHAFSIWETALAAANGNLDLGEYSEDSESGQLKASNWREVILSWPVLNTERLHGDLRLLQRAHFVLAWLVNFYVHSLPPSSEKAPIVVPKALAVPLVAVSQRLGLAPVLTFADTVLWNWELINPKQPMSIENMRFVNLFSGTEDERNFYVASAKTELRGVEILRIIDDYKNLPNITDLTSISKVSRDLTRLATVIEDINEIIQSIRERCDPHVFYWAVRPWYVGGDSSGPGWIYEGVENSDKLDLSGPSAGQSSVMHALDLFLDIDHKLRQRRYPAPSEGNRRADRGFMERMRLYMPGKHREYLGTLSTMPRPLRDLARQTPALREPYDSAVLALKRLRDLHMRIACLYVVTMSRSTPPSGCPVAVMLKKMEAREGPVRGTGGNELSQLLKAGRDATRRAVLKDN